MPITPLHLGLLAPVQRYFPKQVSTPAFILANVLADVPVVLHLYSSKVQDLGGPAVTGTMHETFTHTFLGALLLGVILSLFRFKSKAWWLGCLSGTLSHVALDMFTHSDVHPFAPLTQWNPFYFEPAHVWFSVVLSVGLVYWLLLVSDQRKADRMTKPKESKVVLDER